MKVGADTVMKHKLSDQVHGYSEPDQYKLFMNLIVIPFHTIIAVSYM